MCSFTSVNECLTYIPNIINKYERICGGGKGFGQCVAVVVCTIVAWLCVLVCQAGIHIPQTNCDNSLHASALLFSLQLPWNSATFAWKNPLG